MLHNNIENCIANQNVDTPEDNLKTIILSLFYLSEEAKKSKLEHVSKLIYETINHIDEWVVDSQKQSNEALMDTDTVKMMSFLHQFSALSAPQKCSVASILGELEENPIKIKAVKKTT